MRHEFLRFLLTGCANTAASWAVYLLFNLFLPYAVAYTIAYVFGMFFTYYMNTRWVFKVPMKWSTFMQFPVIFAIRYALDVSVLFVLVHYLGCPETFAPLVTIALTMPIGFLLSRFVLRHRPAAIPAGGAAPVPDDSRS
jgi:putative flippase GtrA